MSYLKKYWKIESSNVFFLASYSQTFCFQLSIKFFVNWKCFEIRFIQPTIWKGAPWIIYAFMKIVSEILEVSFTFAALPGLEFIVVQNPPSIPALIICYITSIFRGWNVYIDWHNFGSLLKMPIFLNHHFWDFLYLQWNLVNQV